MGELAEASDRILSPGTTECARSIRIFGAEELLLREGVSTDFGDIALGEFAAPGAAAPGCKTEALSGFDRWICGIESES